MDSADRVGPDPRIINPDSYEAYSGAAEGKGVRFKDLPRSEQIRSKVEDTVRYYATVHGRILTAAAIGERIHWKVRRVGEITVEDIAGALNDPVTVANLRALGILSPEVMSWDEALEGRLAPTGDQMDALDSVLGRVDLADNKSLEAALDDHGISLKTWNGWLADPIFAGLVKARTEAMLGERAHEIDIALMRRVYAGDVPAIKLMLQMQGRLGDQRAVDTGQLLGRVLEILMEEISDMPTLERLARRFEALSQQVTTGRAPALEDRKTIIPGEVALP